MDIIQEVRESSKNTFFNHVFSTTDESKAEILNIVQYASIGIIPIIVLNKLIQRFIPESDFEKSSTEILAEIFIQILVMFCGIVVIDRIITYIPTYSGYKYEVMNLTNVILAFLVIILSIQSKIGMKTNILYDRAMELWDGSNESNKKVVKKNVRFKEGIQSQHTPSRSDTLDEPEIPALPISTNRSRNQSQEENVPQDFGPQPANGMIGGGFGSLF
jgi:hypothetical protein